MRRPIPPKSETCTEGMVVYAAGIRVKAGAHYPGRPRSLPQATVCPRAGGNSNPKARQLLEQIVAPENMRNAWSQVKRNKGAPGVDGRTIDETASLLRNHCEEIKERLLNGMYQPKPVQRVEIPKPGGGVRKLGVPTVLDLSLIHI